MWKRLKKTWLDFWAVGPECPRHPGHRIGEGQRASGWLFEDLPVCLACEAEAKRNCWLPSARSSGDMTVNVPSRYLKRKPGSVWPAITRTSKLPCAPCRAERSSAPWAGCGGSKGKRMNDQLLSEQMLHWDRLNLPSDAESYVDEVRALEQKAAALQKILTLRPVAEYNEDENGPALFWNLPVQEPPTLCYDPDKEFGEGVFTHWSSLPSPNFMTATDGASVGGA